MEITAALVKELRERTGAGMMECKKALVESGGEIEAAIEAMRKSGQAKADKKAGRIAAEGLIIIRQAGHFTTMVEVNCETDFVAKGDEFKNFCHQVATVILQQQPANHLETLLTLSIDGQTVEEMRRSLIAKIGENIQVRRFVTMTQEEGTRLGMYLHGTRIGVLVKMRCQSAELAKDIAMHIAASRPLCVSPEQVSPALVAKEKEIYAAQAAESGKPANIIEKMVEGRLKKFLNEVSLLGQPFVKDPDQTIEKLLKTHTASVEQFERFEVGEGIEKQSEHFVPEVMPQIHS